MEAAAVLPAPPTELQARLQILTNLPSDQLTALLSGPAERSAPWVAAAAAAGLPEGQVRYGRMLLEGAGVQKEKKSALRWFELAAEGGDAEAENMVGRCYESGWGTPCDFVAAAHWFAKAATKGHAWALYNLGHLYLDGLGVLRDPGRAFALYRQAAEDGHVRAMNLLARCYEEGWGIRPHPAAAAAWYRRSAEGGYFRGQYNHASLLAQAGKNEEAADWIARALANAPVATRAEIAARLAAEDDPTLRDLGSGVLENVLRADQT